MPCAHRRRRRCARGGTQGWPGLRRGDHRPRPTPERSMSNHIEDVALRTADGARLAGDLYYPSGTPRGGVVVVHGFSATRRLDAVVEHARSLADAGFLVLAYDGRGHGTSDG